MAFLPESRSPMAIMHNGGGFTGIARPLRQETAMKPIGSIAIALAMVVFQQTGRAAE
jgi:hypothetical protein